VSQFFFCTIRLALSLTISIPTHASSYLSDYVGFPLTAIPVL